MLLRTCWQDLMGTCMWVWRQEGRPKGSLDKTSWGDLKNDVFVIANRKSAEKIDNGSFFRNWVIRYQLAKAGEPQAWGGGVWTAGAEYRCGIICIHICYLPWERGMRIIPHLFLIHSIRIIELRGSWPALEWRLLTWDWSVADINNQRKCYIWCGVVKIKIIIFPSKFTQNYQFCNLCLRPLFPIF